MKNDGTVTDKEINHHNGSSAKDTGQTI